MNAIPESRARLAWIALGAALIVLVVAVHARGLAGPFLMDDFDTVFPLLGAQAAGADWLDILRAAPHHIRARWVANASFLLTQALAAASVPSAFAAKAGNLGLHLATAFALGALARALALRWGAPPRRAMAAALLAAALFALHPLLVSTVLYAVQRMAQLATLFSLLAVLAYLRWRETLPDATPAAHVVRLAAVAGFAALAFFSKESGALVPLLIGVVELTALRWPARDVPWRSRFDTGFALFCAAPLMLGAVLLALRWKGFMAGYAGRDFDLATRLFTEIHVVAGYLGQIAWPRLAGMGLYHDDVVKIASPTLATFVLGALHALAIVGAILARRRFPRAAFAVLWFYASHALESTVVPLELVFEHRNYLALVGPAIAVAGGVASLQRVGLAAALALAACAALAVQTARRSDDWSSYDRWLAAEAAHHPRSLRAATDVFLQHVGRDRIDAAVEHRNRMLEIFPAHAQPILLKLAFACRGPLPIEILARDELAALGRLELGKDAYHLVSGLRERVPRRCETPDWRAFAAAAMAAASNPGLASQPRAAAAWWRLAADAQRRAGAWSQVRSAVEQVLRREDNDPRDWLLLAEAAARSGDRPAYLQARQRFLALLPNGGRLAGELAQVDRIAQRSLPPAQP